ncbi:MAG: LLM class F420-dependent oxidoreductase [Acidimicrobiia bacterium]|nr:LLM class F420-dependent oxidoreductase [Acidimicrobiia bacterium]
MKLGIFGFPTDLSLDVCTLAREAEERGYHSFWLPDHSHIPSSRRTPPGGRRTSRPRELPDEYRRNIDVMCGLAAAAAVTSEIELGTGVCLVAQRDPIWTAKEVATIDQLSGGRFRFGIGFGWNREEMGHHGLEFATRRAKGREHVLAMRALWTEEEASFSGEYVHFEPSWAWPKPLQRPHPPIYFGGAPVADLFDQIVEFGDGWMPTAPDALDPAPIAELRRRAEAAGRDPDSLVLGVFAPKPDLDHLRELETMGYHWAALQVRPAPARDERETLDRYQPLLEAFGART